MGAEEDSKSFRMCVWGKEEGKRGVHLLKWETLCKPKRCEGEGLRTAKEMNQAILVRMAWRVLTSLGELWSNVLCAKYKVRQEDGAHFICKQHSSRVWRGYWLGCLVIEEGTEVESS